MNSRYFKLEEFLQSDTALRKRIANIPSWDVISNLNRLALFLDGIREAWGSGIGVSSGFRSLQLNAAVGGVTGSAHIQGNAADIYPVNGKMAEFEKFLKDYLKDKQFDSCIYEKSKSTGGRWVHFSLYGANGKQRCKIFNLEAK